MKNAYRAPFLVGLTMTLMLLLFAFGSPEEAQYPKHDFLDHIVTLTAAWNPKVALDFSYQIPHVMASSIPLTALGFSPFSAPDMLFGLFPVDVGWSLKQLLGRIVGFGLMYAVLLTFVSEPNRTFAVRWAAASAATSFALMPYWPNLVWTVNALVLALLGIRLLQISERPMLGRALLFAAPHLAYFAWGGFLIPLIFSSYVAWTYLRKKVRSGALLETMLLFISSALSASGLIYLQINHAFVSHRTTWPPLPLSRWFTQDAVDEAVSGFPLVFLTGLYHFGTLFSSAISPVPGWMNVSFTLALLGLPVLVGHLLIRFRHKDSVPVHSSWTPTIGKCLKLMAIQAALALIWVLEISQATDLKSVLGIPFQIGRLIAISPILWALILYFFLSFAFSRLKGVSLTALGLALLSALAAQGIWMNPSLSSRFDLLSDNHVLENQVSTIPDYFMQDQMSRARELMEVQSPSPRVISLGINPMIAPFSRIESLDGYAFNYPLQHKELFLSVLTPATRAILQEEFEVVTWGSRLQLNPSTKLLTMANFDLCRLDEAGVTHVLSSHSLENYPGTTFQGIYGEVGVYKIQVSALCQ